MEVLRAVASFMYLMRFGRFKFAGSKMRLYSDSAKMRLWQMGMGTHRSSLWGCRPCWPVSLFSHWSAGLLTGDRLPEVEESWG
jgi:hypothetical protein